MRVQMSKGAGSVVGATVDLGPRLVKHLLDNGRRGGLARPRPARGRRPAWAQTSRSSPVTSAIRRRWRRRSRGASLAHLRYRGDSRPRPFWAKAGSLVSSLTKLVDPAV